MNNQIGSPDQQASNETSGLLTDDKGKRINDAVNELYCTYCKYLVRMDDAHRFKHNQQ